MENNVYLPGTPAQRIRDRLGALNMNQAELAKAAGLTEGTLSRILQERTKSIKSQDLVGIARALNVSTDFLLGLTNLPGRKNYSIKQLGLSDQAMQTLVGNQIDRNVLSQLLAHKDFPTITRLIAVYADATMAAGFKAQRDMLQSAKAVLKDVPGAGSAVSAMIRANPDTADVTAIQNGLMKIVRDISSHKRFHVGNIPFFACSADHPEVIPGTADLSVVCKASFSGEQRNCYAYVPKWAISAEARQELCARIDFPTARAHLHLHIDNVPANYVIPGEGKNAPDLTEWLWFLAVSLWQHDESESSALERLHVRCCLVRDICDAVLG